MLLLAIALIIIWQIMPYQDTYATNQDAYNPLIVRMLYTFFMMLPDATVLTVLEGAAFLSKAVLMTSVKLIGTLLGVIMLGIIVGSSSKKKLAYYLLPYALFAMFSALVYFCAHHMGMILSFTIFWLWIIQKDPQKGEVGNKLLKGIKISEQDMKMIQKLGKAGIFFLIVIPLYWTVGAAYLDITHSYYYGRNVASFLKESGLSEAKVMTAFAIEKPEGGEDAKPGLKEINTDLVSRPIAILPYFEHNFVENLGMGKDENAYIIHRIRNEEQTEAVLKQWKEMGPPDVLIGPMNVGLVFGPEEKITYYPVYEYEPYVNIWKAFLCGYNIQTKEYIYVRSELLEKYGLDPLQVF